LSNPLNKRHNNLITVHSQTYIVWCRAIWINIEIEISKNHFVFHIGKHGT